MKKYTSKILKTCLSNLSVDVVLGGFTKCPPDWKDIDYIPDYNKFYFICDGEGWLKIGNQEYYPTKGQLFLMPSGVLQSYSTISSNTFTKYWCHFTARAGCKNLFDFFNMPWFIEVADFEYVEMLFSQLIQCYKTSIETDEICSLLETKALLIKIISYYLDKACPKELEFSNADTSNRMNLILDFIENNLHREITIEELSQISFLHPNYLIRFFKYHLGITPMRYINIRKIERAKNLLLTSQKSIKEICYETGFCDISHFSKNFKKYTGFSPVQFRNMSMTYGN